MGKEEKALIDELCDATKLVKKEVSKIVQKGDLTVQELDSLYKAACFAEKMTMICNEDQDADYSSYGNTGWTHVPPINHGYSERRGRSPVTGRYISRGIDGYSGHSVEDRMIASLEQEMDNTKSDYERGKIEDEIRHIRMGTR